ncbi:MAG: trypsin-like peptidase domain-containing protein [Nitrososphaerota archaeon]
MISVNSYAQTTAVDDTLLPKLFERVKNSVVQITVSGEDPRSSALGSGFIFDTSGHIITNDHVVRNRSFNDTSTNNTSTNNVTVTFLDDRSFKAKIVGSDPFSDLAVLQIENPNNQSMIPLVLSNSSDVKIGEHVIAIGNPFGLSGSMTEGIVSGLGRVIPSQNPEGPPGPELMPDEENRLVPPPTSFSIPEIIQTDAAINPGNSGGPLLNLRGQAIGINSAIFSLTGAYTGVGFAIPSSTIQRVVPVLISEHSYKHPWIGISGVDLNEQIASAMKLNTTKGFLVIDTSPGGPASKAGIQGGDKMVEINGRETNLYGDVIVKIDNQNVSKIDDILIYLEQQKKVGQSVNLTVIRDGNLETINVVLAERPQRLDTEPLWLGIDGIDMDEQIASELMVNQSTGILVVAVISDGPADKAGLEGGYRITDINGTQIELGGDIIITADNQTIENLRDMSTYISNNKVEGDTIGLGILRDGKPQEIEVTLEARPMDQR